MTSAFKEEASKFLEFSVRQRKEGIFLLVGPCSFAAVKGQGLLSLVFHCRFRGVLISQLPISNGEGAGVLQAVLTGADRICLFFCLRITWSL